MIHHISIPAENPLRVAQVLADIWNGRILPFPAHADSYVVMVGDEFGSMVEIYPAETVLVPGREQEQVGFSRNTFVSRFTAIHAAISVPTTQVQIEEIGAREGWRVVRCSRDGYFEVIEFWVENKLMLELLPPALTPQYLAFMQPQNLERLLAAPIPTVVAV